MELSNINLMGLTMPEYQEAEDTISAWKRHRDAFVQCYEPSMNNCCKRCS